MPPVKAGLDDEDADEFEDSDDDLDDEDDEDSDDSMGGVADTKEFIAKLESDIQGDPFNAELHAALISTLREAAKLDQLTKARRRAASQVVLPESLWFEWLQDEGRLASDSDFDDLEALHKTAVAACPMSSRIWLSWCNLRRERPGGSVEATRAAFEEALETLGLHPYEGPEIWAEYRDFEESQQQVQRSRSLFLRQLALPMPGLDRLKEAYMTFENALDSKLQDKMAAAKAEAILEESSAAWQEREDLERRLREAGRPMVSLVVAGSVEDKGAPELSAELLALEEASDDSERIFLGHLRVTQWAPAEEGRWRSFADFTSNTLKDHRKAVLVLERAVRNCPRCSDLWLWLHLEHEAAGSQLKEMRQLTERGVAALKSGQTPTDASIKDLLMQQADACRRAAAAAATADLAKPCWEEMRSVLEKAVMWLQGQQGGPCCTTLLHWMRLEAYAVRSADATLAVGNRLMEVWGGYYNAWSAFIAAVRYCLGNDAYRTVSKLFERAVAAVADYPDQVRSDHVQFERECGTLDSWRAARDAAQQYQQAAALAAQATQGSEAAQGSESAQELQEAPTASAASEETPATAAPASEESTAGSALGACFDEVFMQDLFKHARAGNTQVLSAMLNKAAASAAAAAAAENQTSQENAALPKKDDTAAAGTQPDQASKRQQKWANTASMRKKKRLAKQAEAKKAEEEEEDEEAGEEEQAEEEQPEEEQAKPEAAAVKDREVVETNKKQAAEPVAVSSSPSTEAVQHPAEASAESKQSAADSRSEPKQIPEPSAAAAAESKQPQAVDSETKADAKDETKQPAAADSQEAIRNDPVQKSDSTAEPAAQASPSVDTKAADAEGSDEKGAAVKREAHMGSHYHQKRLKAGNAEAPAPEAEGKQTIYVSNLDWSVDEPQLYRIFSDVPGLKEVRLVRDFLKRSKGYAYIDFEKSEQVGLAVEKMNGHVVNKRIMGVARSLPTKPLFEEKTVFVKKLSPEVKEADVKSAFAAKGEIVEVRMPLGSEEGSHKGYAYVEFSTADSATAALDLHGSVLGGQAIEVARSIPMKDHRHQTAAPRKDLPQRSNQRQIMQGRAERSDPVQMANKFSTTIYVKNLAFKVDDNALRDHFKECGKVQQVLICRNAKGTSRGFGFVEFENADQAQSALTYNDSILHGREIWVSKSQRAITAKKQANDQEAKEEKKEEKEQEVQAQVPKAATPAKGKRRLDLGDKPEVPVAKAPKTAEVAVAAEAKRPFRANKDPVTPAAPVTQESKQADDGKEKAEAEQPVKEAPAGKMSNADFRALLLKG